MGSPWGEDFFDKPVTLTIGLANTANTNDLITVNSEKLRLERISMWPFLVCCIIVLVVLGAIFWFAPHTGLLRNGDVKTQWSLARCQMAFWFVLIILSFLFVWVVTGALDTITPQTLVMMGLSSGTLLGAALIEDARDDNKRLEEIAASIKNFTAENIALHAQLAPPAVAPPPPADAALTALQGENDRRIKALKDEVDSLKKLDKTHGLFKDILSDRTGSPALHRFQVVAWTLVLGFIFLFSVWKHLSMPSFSDTLLALMGLSSATYLGFKGPEK